VTGKFIDRDLIAKPPHAISSERYAELFRAHILQATGHFSRWLPRRGLLSMLRPGTDSKLREALSGAFAAAYTRLLTEPVIPLTANYRLDGVIGTGAERFGAAIAFVTSARKLIVADRFLKPLREIRHSSSEDHDNALIECFADELVTTIGRLLSDLRLTTKQKIRACYRSASGITLDLDYHSLDQPLNGPAVAPVLCHVDAVGRLVLVPHRVDLHENVDSLTAAYFVPMR
jgi:hypothetical protein